MSVMGSLLLRGMAVIVLFLAIAGYSFPQPAAVPIPVYPGAEGFGTLTPAGRHGKIIKVTNLLDHGPGSLRAAIEVTEPRIVVFEVGGAVHLDSPLRVGSPFLTLAGQTAPFPGITLVGYGLQIAASEVLVQHLFIRLTKPGAEDGIQLKTAGNRGLTNIVIDHLSVSWANDENISCFHDSASNITFSNCILGEGHYGMLIADGSRNISVLRNLFISAEERQPRIGGDTSVQLVNNLSYNVGARGSTVVGSQRGGSDVIFAANLYLDGPDTSQPSYGIRIDEKSPAASLLYIPLSGPHANLGSQNVIDLNARNCVATSIPRPLAVLEVLPVERIEGHVTAQAGARPAERLRPDGDAVDRRLLAELRSRCGSVKGRIKPAWQPPPATSRPFEIPGNHDGDDDGDGYTNIEEFLHRMARALEP